MTISLAALAINSYLMWTNWGQTMFWIAVVLEVLFVGAVALWVWIVRPAFVDDAAQAYALRLLSACD